MVNLALAPVKAVNRGESFKKSVALATATSLDKLSLSCPQVAYRIVHDVPGRIRFRIPKIVHDLDYSQALQALVSVDEEITHLKVKRAAGSVTFYYQPEKISQKESRSYCIELIQLANHPDIYLQRDEILSQCEKSDNKISWSALKLPMVATVLALLNGPLGLTLPALVVRGIIAAAAVPVAKRAWESFQEERKLNVDFLDLSAITIVTAQSHFLTSCSMLVLIQLGETIRELTARSSQSKALDLLSSLAQSAWVEREGQKLEIPLEQLLPEDTVIVYPGEQIPVDGHILRGKALIDEQRLTGESMPVVKNEGEMVYASTLVREGQIYVLAERLGEETRAGQTLKMLKEVPIHDTRMENYAAKLADRTVMPTLLLGSLVFALTRNPARAASVLTIDFATGIRVSVPTTIMAALYGAARRGVLIRSGRALEQLAQVDAIVFDKTGTLTQGNIQVIGIKTASPDIAPQRVIQLAAAAEKRITHPVAEAVIRYAKDQKLDIPSRGEWDYQVGLGIRADIEGHDVLVGSERFLIKEGVNVEPLYDHNPELKEASYPLIYVASDGEIMGVLEYTDPLRAESPEVIRALREDIGAEIHILTGDNQQRAAAVAQILNIPPSQTHAEAFPETKAQIVQDLHNQGLTVAFVGDGLNDSAALAYADVSVSFRDGSDVARETADVVLMRNNLEGLVEAITIARNAKKIIYQNAGIVGVPNLCGLAIAATVGINPMTATMINNGSSVLAGMNGLRPVLTAKTEDEEQQ
ncbi:heavy metal translocating P-type ATPase [Gloeothece citriformis PCC 7424]|uniref:Heavy metal translocating P-type ATPase n=1 Tax=Gloeothece citriformis (strain PCC 7424) TaxID=65393 RepID=B7KE59_GLOC7|nr:heavy metal translocating P-type ATPase [Gloeothece citriformis]ACK71757.1 heavy metal translocating P-type ATPase [Gloeothece citriformis PCC 7424]